jgi:hypothetical protein
MSENAVAQSIKDRLMRRVRAERLSFNQVFTLFALERLLYRVGASPYSRQFVLKGGLMMRASGAPLARPTRDADLEGFIDSDPRAIERVFQDIARIPCPEDGVTFHPEGVTVDAIQLDTEYGGVRVTVPGSFGTARFSVQVDIGFGDAITPGPIHVSYPTWLDHLPGPQLFGYPLETTIAEKYETLFRRREANSRAKDWYDLWMLASTRPFEGPLLQAAIANTFQQRLRPFEERPDDLYRAIAETPSRIANWNAFKRTLPHGSAPDDLLQLLLVIGAFLDPIMQACWEGKHFEGRWDPSSQRWSR